MRLVGSQSQDMDERLSTSARLVRSPGSQTRIHSIESILGFKGENIFHPAFSYGSGKPIKDTEHVSSHKKDSSNSKHLDGELTASQVTFSGFKTGRFGSTLYENVFFKSLINIYRCIDITDR